MPELPEVEVTRLGIHPYVVAQTVRGLVLRRDGLRWPFPANLAQKMVGQRVQATGRRGKYLLIFFANGVLIIHLGMSGRIQLVDPTIPARPHDHVDLILEKHLLRLTDPRRFGAVLWHDNAEGPVEKHPLLQGLGMEPLSGDFNGSVLYKSTRHRKVAVKQMLLAGDVVVGVGNIYACESLFLARINPFTPVNQITLARYNKLAFAIQQVLTQAIAKGGSSLRDFLSVDGQSGYFQQDYFVYSRANLPCKKCNALIQQVKQGQRSTFYCAQCQVEGR